MAGAEDGAADAAAVGAVAVALSADAAVAVEVVVGAVAEAAAGAEEVVAAEINLISVPYVMCFLFFTQIVN